MINKRVLFSEMVIVSAHDNHFIFLICSFKKPYYIFSSLRVRIFYKREVSMCDRDKTSGYFLSVNLCLITLGNTIIKFRKKRARRNSFDKDKWKREAGS